MRRRIAVHPAPSPYSLAPGLREMAGGLYLLTRTFFRRFFESDVIQPGLTRFHLAIWGAGAVLGPGLLLSSRFGITYGQLAARGDLGALAEAMRVHRLLLVTLSMAILGLVALVIWEAVYPDRRDARHLGVLPLPASMLMLARLSALGMLAAIFLVAVNAIPAVAYGPLVGLYGTASSSTRGVVATIGATMAAGAFAFASLIAAQGTLLCMGGRRAAERTSALLQIALVVALVELLVFLPQLGALLRHDLTTVEADPLLRWIPSFWFLGLYDVLGGRPSAGSATFATMAIVGTLAAGIVAVTTLLATHQRLMRLALESRPLAASRSAGAGALVVSRIAGRACRDSVQRAVLQFTARTLARSRPHRMLGATALGVGAAIVAAVVGPIAFRQGLRALEAPSVMVLAVPFVLMFVALITARLLFGMPVEAKANWIVRLVEPGDRRTLVDGVRNAMLLWIVYPITVLAAASSWLFWGAWPAAIHTLTCVGMGWLLTEILLFNFRKIPFTCVYFPGRSRLHDLWPLYVLALTIYAVGAANLELAVLSRPGLTAPASALVLGGVIWLLTALRTRRLAEPFGLIFEDEDPDALFGGFHFSEVAATQGTRDKG